MQKPVLIFGAGQVAQQFAECIRMHQPWRQITAFVVNASHWQSATFIDGVPVVAFENVGVVTFIPPADYCFAVGMSFKGLNKVRAEKYAAMLAKGYEPLTFIAEPSRVAKGARIGAGSFVQDMNTIQSNVVIGQNCVVWAGNHIGHDARIGDHVWISSGVTISGAVEIGDRTFVGSGATIADNVTIGKRNIIGAGSLILKDTPDDAVFSPGGTEISRVPSYKMRGVWGQ